MKKYITKYTTAGTILEIRGADIRIANKMMREIDATMVRYEGGNGYGLLDLNHLDPRIAVNTVVSLTFRGDHQDQEGNVIENWVPWEFAPWWLRWVKRFRSEEIKKPEK